MIELKDKLTECAKINAQNANVSATRYKSYFYLKSQDCQSKAGDEALILLPDNSSKLLMSWSGPSPVLEQRNRVNYHIDERGKPKLYHANLLKKYHRRVQVHQAQVIDEIPTLDSLVSDTYSVKFCVVEESPDLQSSCCQHLITPDGKVDLASDKSDMLEVQPELAEDQQADIHQLISNFDDCFPRLQIVHQLLSMIFSSLPSSASNLNSTQFLSN